MDESELCSLPILKRFEPWIKFDVRNILNDDTQIGWDHTIIPITKNPDGTPAPVDQFGLPTTFRKASSSMAAPQSR